VFFVFWLLAQGSGQASAVSPPMPSFDRTACWCEKCDRDPGGGWVAAKALTAHKKRTASSPRVFAVLRNERVAVLDGVVVTYRPERIRIVKRVTIPVASLTLEPGDTLFVVNIRAEGDADIWYHGRVMGASIDGPLECAEASPASSCTGIVEQSAIRQWWIKIRNHRGQVGWVRADWNFYDETCGVGKRR
jgi:hypothetical protein